MTRLLINESPLMVLPTLAKHIGLNEAIILQQIHYWLDSRINNNIHRNVRWVYNSYNKWLEQFPFWSEKTIKRTILNLEQNGLIISDNFNSDKFNKTKWYTINYAKLIEIEQICFSSKFLKPEENNDKDKMSHSKRQNVLFENLTTLSDEDKVTPSIVQNDSIIGLNCPKDEVTLSSSFNRTKTTTEITKNKKTLSKKTDKLDDESVNEMIEIWNEIIEQGKEGIKLTPKRKVILLSRFKNFFSSDLKKWKEFCQLINSSAFLRGEVTDFRANIDWATKEDYLVKILEGGYSSSKQKPIVENAKKEQIIIQEENEIMQNLKTKMLEILGEGVFRAWFSEVRFITFEDSILKLKTPSKFKCDWIKTHYMNDIIFIMKEKIANIQEIVLEY